jgi:hypothetical protein
MKRGNYSFGKTCPLRKIPSRPRKNGPVSKAEKRLSSAAASRGLRKIPNTKENNKMSIYEALGIGYVVVSTTFFTALVIYFGVKGLACMQRLVQRAHAEETLDLQRSLSIKRELAEVD